MERFTGLLGIVLILGVAFLMSNNRKAINYRTVGVGLLLQVVLAATPRKEKAGQKGINSFPAGLIALCR